MVVIVEYVQECLVEQLVYYWRSRALLMTAVVAMLIEVVIDRLAGVLVLLAFL